MAEGVQRSRLHFTVGLLKHEVKIPSLPADPLSNLFLHLSLLPSETYSTIPHRSLYVSSPPTFTQTSFQSLLSIFVRSALCQCTDSFKQISLVKSGISTWNGTEFNSHRGSRWWYFPDDIFWLLKQFSTTRSIPPVFHHNRCFKPNSTTISLKLASCSPCMLFISALSHSFRVKLPRHTHTHTRRNDFSC